MTRALSVCGRIICVAALVLAPLLLALCLGLIATPGSKDVDAGLSLVFPMWAVAALMIAPPVLFPGLAAPTRPPEPDGGEDGDEGGGGPRRPMPGPTGPGSSGPPLPDADQPRRRTRDHGRPAWQRPARRPVREPRRRPVRAPVGRR